MIQSIEFKKYFKKLTNATTANQAYANIIRGFNMKPIHLDYTTVYGAALAIESKELKNVGLPLSRLLNLSQLIETLVLYDQSQYELGNSYDWIPYRDALEKTELAKLSMQKKFPMKSYENQVDQDENLIRISVDWAIKKVEEIPFKHLYWAVNFRQGTYSSFKFTSDVDNPTLRKYIEIFRSSNIQNADSSFEKAIKYLNANEIRTFRTSRAYKD